MKKMVLSLFIILGLSLYAKTEKDYINEYTSVLKNLSPTRIELLNLVYWNCKKIDMENTCVAIALVESHMGEVMINSATNDYGLMGVNFREFLKRNKIKTKNRYLLDKYKTRLIMNSAYNLYESLRVLKYWMKYFDYKHKRYKWKYVIMAYNAGIYYKNNKRYLKKIKAAIKAFKKFKNKLVYNYY